MIDSDHFELINLSDFAEACVIRSSLGLADVADVRINFRLSCSSGYLVIDIGASVIGTVTILCNYRLLGLVADLRRFFGTRVSWSKLGLMALKNFDSGGLG